MEERHRNIEEIKAKLIAFWGDIDNPLVKQFLGSHLKPINSSPSDCRKYHIRKFRVLTLKDLSLNVAISHYMKMFSANVADYVDVSVTEYIAKPKSLSIGYLHHAPLEVQSGECFPLKSTGEYTFSVKDGIASFYAKLDYLRLSDDGTLELIRGKSDQQVDIDLVNKSVLVSPAGDTMEDFLTFVSGISTEVASVNDRWVKGLSKECEKNPQLKSIAESNGLIHLAEPLCFDPEYSNIRKEVRESVSKLFYYLRIYASCEGVQHFLNNEKGRKLLYFNEIADKRVIWGAEKKLGRLLSSLQPGDNMCAMVGFKKEYSHIFNSLPEYLTVFDALEAVRNFKPYERYEEFKDPAIFEEFINSFSDFNMTIDDVLQDYELSGKLLALLRKGYTLKELLKYQKRGKGKLGSMSSMRSLVIALESMLVDYYMVYGTRKKLFPNYLEENRYAINNTANKKNFEKTEHMIPYVGFSFGTLSINSRAFDLISNRRSDLFCKDEEYTVSPVLPESLDMFTARCVLFSGEDVLLFKAKRSKKEIVIILDGDVIKNTLGKKPTEIQSKLISQWALKMGLVYPDI